MKTSLLPHILLLFLAFLPGLLLSQGSDVTIVGKVIEGRSGQPIEFATVMAVDNSTKKPITGTTTQVDGSFTFKSASSDISVEISFIGFITQTLKNIEILDKRLDLGTIQLYEDSETLDEVVVRADKSTTEFKLDKRVFHVGKDLSSTGASALDVLNNVPSVNVNIEGEISLRGSSGVQVLINGKPSILASEEGNALGTITAEMIEKIEVITNPSAKYDAEGTSGIINIVIKKEERKGLNGSASINTGIPHNHSIGLSLNRRTEKFNLFSQLGYGYRELPREQEFTNRNLIDSTAVQGEGTEYRNEYFYNFVFGTDYHINENNVITLAGNFTYEVEDQPSRNDFMIEDAAGNLESEWYRKEVTEATNPKYRYEFQYKKDFPDHKEHDLLFSAVGNFFGKNQSSQFENTNSTGTEAPANQQSHTEFHEGKHTFNLDYIRPFSNVFTIELGAQYLLNDVSNDYALSDFNNGQWVENQGLTNVFEYDQKVLGAYGTGAYEDEKWGLKLGLRLENTDLQTHLVNTDESNDQNFTNLFPSVHVSYKLTEMLSLQSGYSRRIYRPRLWDLNPFFNIRNTFSIRQGNPDLMPEFTDSYEVSSIFIYNQVSFNFSVYHRYTTDIIERVSRFENNINTFRPENIGTNSTTGLELNGKYSPNKVWTINGDLNYRYFDRSGEFENNRFDFLSNQLTSKVTTKLKLPSDLDFEITYHFQSRYQTVQGEVSDMHFADLGLRKKILNGRGVFNISVRDIFASRIQESTAEQTDFRLYNWTRRGRFLTFGFSYGFGKGEAMEYLGQKRRH